MEQYALEMGGRDTVATCGRWLVEPNAVNSVPRVVTLDIDLRDTDVSRRNGILDSILATADGVGGKRSVRPGSDCRCEWLVSSCIEAALQAGSLLSVVGNLVATYTLCAWVCVLFG